MDGWADRGQTDQIVALMDGQMKGWMDGQTMD